MRRILPILFLIIFLFIAPKDISAQGVFECNWVPTGSNTGICVTDNNNIRCTGNATTNTQFCTNLGPNQATCEAATPTCVIPQEEDRTECDEAGETCCAGGQGGRVCSNSSLICNSSGVCEARGSGSGSGGTTSEKVQCPNRPGTINTAIGCVPIDDTTALTAFFLRWALGIAGGVALLMIGFAGYRIATSQGDPRRLQGGQELLMSAIGGLLMIVLSVYLLRFIGVDLLGLF